jgi:hypothetical protein
MPFTNFLDQRLLNSFLGKVTYTIPSDLYLGVSSTSPSQIQTGSPSWNFTEPVGNAYARVQMSNDSVNFGPILSEPSNGYTIQNLLVVNFLASSGPWLAGAPLGYFGLFDTPTAGNLCIFGSCSPAQTVSVGNITLSLPVGSITATLN